LDTAFLDTVFLDTKVFGLARWDKALKKAPG